MTYYEELAVSMNASGEEIHQAYRVLARVLHPDNQSDPLLRSAAERQMVRLNEILATLSDPEKRRLYNESLRPKRALQEVIPAPIPVFALKSQWPWVLAMGILVGAGLWYLRSNEPGDTAALVRSVGPARSALAETRQDQKESRPRVLPRDRLPQEKSALQKPSPAPEGFSPAESFTPDKPANRFPTLSEPVVSNPVDVRQLAASPVPFPQPAVATAPAIQRAVVHPPGSPFAGYWLYAAGSREPRTPGMYAPEFIQFFLSEEQGGLAGRYWARYRIPDKPLSPEVEFRVNGGQMDGKATTLKWVSDDGGNGQMKVVLRGSDSMEVTWWTTGLGRQMALTSGTAVLIRQYAR
jgi:curved DNA-binding protein CbpA